MSRGATSAVFNATRSKKPFFHALPGALAYSFGMLGCDLHCSYCQNWVTSQALRDPAAVFSPSVASPESVVQDAVRLGARVVVSTYTELLIERSDTTSGHTGWLRAADAWSLGPTVRRADRRQSLPA